jgi:hypothetical protein
MNNSLLKNNSLLFLPQNDLSEDKDNVLLGCGAALFCRWVPAFWKYMLLPSPTLKRQCEIPKDLTAHHCKNLRSNSPGIVLSLPQNASLFYAK